MLNASEFEQFVAEHQFLVFRTLTRLMGTREVEDQAQDVFFRLYRALPQFRGDAELTTYLYRIAVNVACDARRKQGRERQRAVSLSEEDEPGQALEHRLAHPGQNAEEALCTRQFTDAVESALRLLSATERAVLVLYHQEEQTYEAIAEALLLPINTVRTHLHRGRKKLRALLSMSGQQKGAAHGNSSTTAV